MTEPTGGLIVAAFDLDGTLTDGHSVVDFATRVAGRPGLVRAGLCGLAGMGLPPRRVGYKQAVLARVLRGRSETEVRSAAGAIATELVDQRLLRGAADQLAAHAALGHATVLVTAALDVYATEVAALLGIDGVVATEVEIVEGRCTGRLIDADLHDERKVERLRAWLGPQEPAATVFAYGNSEDDAEMLRYAEATQARQPGALPVGPGPT